MINDDEQINFNLNVKYALQGIASHDLLLLRFIMPLLIACIPQV